MMRLAVLVLIGCQTPPWTRIEREYRLDVDDVRASLHAALENEGWTLEEGPNGAVTARRSAPQELQAEIQETAPGRTRVVFRAVPSSEAAAQFALDHVSLGIASREAVYPMRFEACIEAARRTFAVLHYPTTRERIDSAQSVLESSEGPVRIGCVRVGDRQTRVVFSAGHALSLIQLKATFDQTLFHSAQN